MYLYLCNVLDSTLKVSGPVESDPHALDRMASDQDYSEMAVRWLAETAGGVIDRDRNLRLYITGEAIG